MSHKNPKAVVDYRADVHALRPLALNGKIPKELFVATMKQNLPEVPKAPAAYIREIRNLRSLLSNGKITEEEYEKKKEDCKQITNSKLCYCGNFLHFYAPEIILCKPLFF